MQTDKQNSPILQRTSDFYDDSTYIHDYDRYDSVSAFSGSTIADSEFVAQQIKQFERDQNSDAKKANAKPVTYNLRIDKVVIDGNSKKEGIDKEAVNQIFSNFNKTPEKFNPRKDTKWERVREFARKPKFLVPFLAFLMVLIGLSIGLPLITKDKNGDKVTTETPTTLDNGSTEPSLTDFSSTTRSTSTSSTTIVPSEPQIVKREVWEKEGLPLEGKYKQLLPIQKIIVMNTKTEPCFDKPSCIDAMVNLQQEAYPEFEDIQENFLISTTGTVYEARGFAREGQTTYEDSLSSFNTQAVSISFMTNDDVEEAPNSKQKETFCYFIERSILDDNLSDMYKVFHRSDLLSSYYDTQELNEDFGSCQMKYEKSPKIVKRRDWNAKEFPAENDFLFRRRSSKVIVANAEGKNCDSIETCGLIIKSIQDNSIEEIEFNFIFGANFTFEGIHFDMAVSSDFYDSLYLLVLGDFQTTQSAEEVFRRINAFLSFAVDVSKLSQDYKIYGERQVKDTSGPGEMLFSIIKEDPHYGESYDFNCNQECTTEVSATTASA